MAEINNFTYINHVQRFKNAHLAKFDSADWVLEKINNYVKNPIGFLMFFGNPGIGKTYFCYAYINYLYEQKKMFRFYNERDYFSALKDEMKKDWDPLNLVKRICDTEFVFYNDLASGRPEDVTEWQKEQVFAFIDERYENKKPTIITSNHFLEELGKIFPARLLSRLKDSRNTLIELTDVDKRTLG